MTEPGGVGNTNSPRTRVQLCGLINKFMKFLFDDVSSSSLGIVRMLFGLLMVIDIFDERGLQNLDDKFNDPLNCFFPLISWFRPLPFPYMGFIYFIMSAGAFGMCIGYKYHLSCILFTIPYWYIFLLDKTTWNNHSYLYGLVSILLLCSSANNSYSIDGLMNKNWRNQPVPRWNYWMLRFQFFLLYFYAGLKKADSDWLGGHSMVTLSEHWVFDPFRIILDNDRIDFWIVHIFGFLLDLTIGFWLILPKTRLLAILLVSSFHLMNSRLFHIGQFPYVCLATTPIFCDYSWPEKLFSRTEVKEKVLKTCTNINTKQKIIFWCLLSYIGVQFALPYSHSITQGYNNWTQGLYGYSWDMMVHSWNVNSVTITVIDNNTGKQLFVDPDAWVNTNRYSRHADMLKQYAECLGRNLRELTKNSDEPLTNISIYADVWCSLNNRFQQRMFDPHQDLLTAEWGPFQRTKWLMPVLSELTPWRNFIRKSQEQIFSWNNYSDVLFVADFPNFSVEHFVQENLSNVTVQVLQGSIGVTAKKYSIMLKIGEKLKLRSGWFYNMKTLSREPSCVIYTFQYLNRNEVKPSERPVEKRYYGMSRRFNNFLKGVGNLVKAFTEIYFDISQSVLK